ncbi:methylated-DNA--[protein]-cysteine S-methyltransferase [Cetobacterium sp. 2A]|nr:methylated-DNA--[protein]-cysteine S-methyltransferase [Cetobacterium sp. 2A]
MIRVINDEDYLLGLDFIDEELKQENKNKLTENIIKQLSEYFIGERLEFNIPILLNGTEFQKNVWKELIKIPYGETATYKDIAVRIGNPKAVRAVGGANNKNKIAVVIPCHRVIGMSGKLVGYAGGISKKEWLLNHENKNKKLIDKR